MMKKNIFLDYQARQQQLCLSVLSGYQMKMALVATRFFSI